MNGINMAVILHSRHTATTIVNHTDVNKVVNNTVTSSAKETIIKFL